jgi:hypothetical protein
LIRAAGAWKAEPWSPGVCKGSNIKAPYANQIGTVPVPYKGIGSDGERESNPAFAMNFGIFLGERPLKFFVFEMRLQ